MNEQPTLRAWRALIALCLAVCLVLSLGPARAQEQDVRYTVDFPYMRSVFPDSVAWLYQPDTDINQPLMYSADPTYYFKRGITGRRDQYGALYLTGEVRFDFSDSVITIYGKNCLDYSLFGSLSEYAKEAYYQAHPSFYLLTAGGEYQLDVFAGIHTKAVDTDSWNVEGLTTQELYSDVLPGLLERSFFAPRQDFLPTPEDSWAVLSAPTSETSGSRYVIYARKRPIRYTSDARTVRLNEMTMDERETQNGRVTVEGVGSWMVYAQNDPLWDRLVFEAARSKRRRPFGDGGCGPTAVAMALANLVDEQELPKLNDYASQPYGYRFCTCSVNDLYCSGRHLPYRMKTPEQFLRYFPLAVANFATGNNIWGAQGRFDSFGTSMRYLQDLCNVYDVSVLKTSRMSEALAFLKNEGTIAVACTSGYTSPFTSTSHFLVLAGVDDTYLYVLDPYRRSHYNTVDEKGYLEILAPGVVRVTLKNALDCGISPIYLLQKRVSRPAQRVTTEPW